MLKLGTVFRVMRTIDLSASGWITGTTGACVARMSLKNKEGIKNKEGMDLVPCRELYFDETHDQ